MAKILPQLLWILELCGHYTEPRNSNFFYSFSSPIHGVRWSHTKEHSLSLSSVSSSLLSFFHFISCFKNFAVSTNL